MYLPLPTLACPYLPMPALAPTLPSHCHQHYQIYVRSAGKIGVYFEWEASAFWSAAHIPTNVCEFRQSRMTPSSTRLKHTSPGPPPSSSYCYSGQVVASQPQTLTLLLLKLLQERRTNLCLFRGEGRCGLAEQQQQQRTNR